jgi:nitrogen regulatory protein PII
VVKKAVGKVLKNKGTEERNERRKILMQLWDEMNLKTAHNDEIEVVINYIKHTADSDTRRSGKIFDWDQVREFVRIQYGSQT